MYNVHRWIAIALCTCVTACDPATLIPVAVAPKKSVASATVHSTLTDAPTFIVRDPFGRAVEGIPLTIRVTAGGGTLTGAPLFSDDEPISVGAWQLGTLAGVNEITVEGEGIAPLVITVLGVAGPAAHAEASGPTSASGQANAAAPIVPAITVTDEFGNPVAGVHVTATVSGGGTVANDAPVTNALGVASVGSWTLGPNASVQTVTLTAPGLPPVVFTVTLHGPFHIEIRFFGPDPSAPARAAFTAAAQRLEQIIVGDLPDFAANNIDVSVQCGATGLGVINETIDDLVIYATISPIDGTSGILGQAGPCDPLRQGSFLPALGFMQFDVADVDNMLVQGTFQSVVLHEMTHVLGFGTTPWFTLRPLTGVGTNDPIFTGPAARAEFLAAGGTTPAGVPVEAGGGSGTALSHWRESVFRNELMTGFVSGATTLPYSRVTIASLADIGYTVSYATADPFSVAAPGSMPSVVATAGEWERVLMPPSFRPKK